LEDMLKEIYEECEIEEEESLDFLNSFDVPEAEEVELVDEEENYACLLKEILCDVDNISGEYKRAAVEYWRSDELKPRTINSVKSRFRKVISTRQLMEKQINVDGNRKEKLRQISTYILDKFTEAVTEQLSIISISYDGLCKRNDRKLIQALHEWVRRFKLVHQIVSGKIIKFIIKKSLILKESLDVDSNRFIENVKYYIERYGIENV